MDDRQRVGAAAGNKPQRKWTAKISVANARAAAHEHAQALLAARRRYEGVSLPDEETAVPDDLWPRGGDLGEGVSLRRLRTLPIVQRIGKALGNCLEYSTHWHRLHETGAAAVYAVIDGGEIVGAIAVGRDMVGALAIIEQGGPNNAPLPERIDRAVRKWLGAAKTA